MSYAVQPPPVAVPPTARRPAAVTIAVALLWAMAAAGLTYAIGVVAVTPGVVSRFRDATSGSTAAENYVTVIWLVGALAPVLSLIFTALFVVLGAALRRGSRPARLIALGVCAFGLVTGFGTLGVLAAQRAGDPVSGSIGEALNQAYPSGWITLNFAVAIAQVVGYLVLGALLLMAPREYFGSGPDFVPGSGPGFAAGSGPGFAAGSVPDFVTGSRPGFAAGSVPGFVPGDAPGFVAGTAQGFVAPSQFVAPSSPLEWAAPQTKPFVTGGSEPDQFSHPAVLPKSTPGPEDEYWSRPSE